MRRLSAVLCFAAASAACVTVGDHATPPRQADAAELLARADEHFDGRRFESALETYQMAAVAASSAGDRARYVEAAAQAAQVLALRGNTARAHEWFAYAEARASEEDPDAWARMLFTRGVLAHAEGRGDEALAGFSAAYGFAAERALPVRAVQAAHMASVVSDGAERVQWCRRAVEAAEELSDVRLQSQLWSQLAWILEERGLPAEALTAFARARELAPPEEPHQRLVADWSYAHGLRVNGHLAPARALLSELERGLEADYARWGRPNDAEWIGHVQRELAEIEVREGDDRKALLRLRRSKDSLLQAGAEELAPDVLRQVDRRIAELERIPSAARREP